MKLINYINKKFSAKTQRLIVIIYLFIGFPIGQLFSTFVVIYTQGAENIHYQSYINAFILNVLFLSPIIISYYLNVRKYKTFINKVKDKNEIVVTSLYNHLGFIKNEKYTVICYDIGKDAFFVFNDNNLLYLKDNINYFDVDNLSENRKKKLKKLNRKLF